MKRTLLWIGITLGIAAITFASGLKVATDRQRGFSCTEWLQSVFRDAYEEGAARDNSDDRFNIAMTVFTTNIHAGISQEGLQAYRDTKEPGKISPAPHRICALDFSGSSEWKKIGGG